MKRARPRPHARLLPSSATTFLMVVAACLVAALAAAWPAAANAGTVARGLADYTIVSMTPADQATALHQIRSELGATYVRFFVSWAQAEPQQGVVDPSSAYLQGVASAVSLAHADGLKVMISFQTVPVWASDHTYWKQTSGYQPYDAMSPAHLGDFQTFCDKLATLLRGQVFAYECWNEPNLYGALYPQSTRHDPNFAAHLYVRMLRSFSKGMRAGDPKALRVAGATAPWGSATPNAFNTSPQRFAAVIKATKGWSSLFDAYSHHPYTMGAPEMAPRDPGRDVTLQNLSTLLKIFPTKPFYLTEYGYQTAPCEAFTGWHVNQVTQANYLRRAYAYAARYKQVKMLMWYLMNDFSPPGAAYQGWYTGLRTADGTAKAAWYVFAGGDHLSLNTSAAAVKRAAKLTLSGQVSCTPMGGGLAAKPLVVQSRRPGHPWTTIRTVVSQAAGAYTGPGLYSVQVSPKASAYYRVAWLGVVTSRTRYVAVK